MNKKAHGFTIVELLIVIVIIAILAAITLVAYNGITNRANDTTVKSDLSSLAKKYELYRIDSPSGVYPFGNELLKNIDFHVSGKNAYMTAPSTTYNLLNCTSSLSSGADFAVLGISKSGKKFYTSSNSGGVQEYTGSVSWTGTNTTAACASVLAGSWANGAGYSAGDTTTGPWRAWTN